jgi:hypothetical protein
MQQHVTPVHEENEGAVEISFTVLGLIARHSQPSLEGEFHNGMTNKNSRSSLCVLKRRTHLRSLYHKIQWRN